MSGGYFDVYVLARQRSADAAIEFLDHFAPIREQLDGDYSFPQYSGTSEVVFDKPMDAIHYCEKHPAESQSLYFQNLRSGPVHAMIFFTSDGEMIFGLSVPEGDDGLEKDCLNQLKEFARTSIGYIDFEAPPPDTAAEFKVLAATRVWD